MNITKKQFRLLVILSVATAIAGVVVSLVTESSLPAPLRDYLKAQSGAEMTTQDAVLLVLSIPLLILLVISVIALYRFRPAARPFTVATWVLGLLLLPAAGPTVNSGWATMFYECSTGLFGMILALIYFSPVRDYFQGDVPETFRSESDTELWQGHNTSAGLKLGIVGGVVAILGSLLPWATAEVRGEIVAIEGVRGAGIFTLALAAAGILLLRAHNRAAHLGSLLAAALAATVCVLQMSVISESIAGIGGRNVSVGYGLYAALVGTIMLLVGAAIIVATPRHNDAASQGTVT